MNSRFVSVYVYYQQRYLKWELLSSKNATKWHRGPHAIHKVEPEAQILAKSDNILPLRWGPNNIVSIDTLLFAS